MALEVSNKWKEAIKSQFRYPGYLKVLLALVPDEIREVTSVTTSQTEGISSPAQLNSGSSVGRAPVATFEKNRWSGEGSQYLPSTTTSENDQIEWWSNTVNFDQDHPIDLVFDFPRVFSFAGLFVTWDTETNSWPTDWEIIGYDEDGSIKQRYRITSTSSVYESVDTPFDNVTKVLVRIYQWSKEHWRVRVNELVFGTYLNLSNDSINRADFSATVSPIMSELPTCQFSVTFSNYDKAFDPQLQRGYSRYLSRKQVLKVQWGFETSYGNVEWMDPWPLYLYAWKIPADSPEVTLTAQSRLSFMDTEYIKGQFAERRKYNMYNLAVDVLENSNILKETDSETPWEIDPDLKTCITSAPLPIAPTNTLLQLIAGATGRVLDTDLRNGYIRIRKPVNPTEYVVGVAQQLGDPAFEIQEKLKSIKVNLYSYKPADTASEVYNAELTLSGPQDVVCYYNSGIIAINPGISVENAQVKVEFIDNYAQAAILRITPLRPGTVVNIRIIGQVVEKSITTLEMYNDYEVDRGVEVVVDNELITEMATAKSVADYLINYYKRRNHMNVSYIGYPELENGDRISIPTNYGDDTGDIVSTKLTFNGGFNGTLKVISTKEG